jgi:hypothetical protein
MVQGLRRVMFVAALFVSGAGCIGDKSAYLNAPSVVAVDTYGPVDFTDACVASKADLCSTETLQKLEKITVDPPGMLEIISGNDVPADLKRVANYEMPFAMHGLVPGSGQLCLQGLFSDGSHRRTCVPAAVRAIAQVRLVRRADFDGVAQEPLVPPGLQLGFAVEFLDAGGKVLSGDTLGAIDSSAFTQGAPKAYTWQAPTQGGSVTFGSPLDPSFSATVATYTAADVTAIHAGIIHTGPVVLTPGQAMNFELAMDAGGRRAAVRMPITIRTDTPDLCTSEDGATTWVQASDGGEPWFKAVSEGTCHLAFSVAGGSGDLGTFDLAYYLVDSQNYLTRDQSAGDGCPAQSPAVCSRDRASVLACRSKKRTVASECSPGICDYSVSATCSDPAGCAACR